MIQINFTWTHFMVFLFVFLAMYTGRSQALQCYVCNSTLDQNCNEKFELTPYNPIKMEPCNVYGARYCIKVYGMWGGTVGTHRFCSSRDMGHQCQDIWYPDHDRMYRSCIFTCSGDGCNAAENLKAHMTLFVYSFFAFLLNLCFYF